MSENLTKYNDAFCRTFLVTAEQLPDLQYQGIEAWDSVGHMTLMGVLEEAFDIMLDPDDVIGFSSYAKGMEILGKYGITF
ncbi:MAG: acyl carrier protein [Candidatus Anaerobiospirillum pullicola]|uniref:Acyl carrier protein n=1 Tax=Candidatus Anaerobiospirillum pullicola TaxID=2838451 RepID=A0A948WY87_9GAMM|nr:acyl carrier protein [Candidatus Anaerobiospirillum pullicola]